MAGSSKSGCAQASKRSLPKASATERAPGEHHPWGLPRKAGHQGPCGVACGGVQGCLKGGFSSSPPLLRVHPGKQLLAADVWVWGRDFSFPRAAEVVPALETEGLTESTTRGKQGPVHCGWAGPSRAATRFR